MIGDAAAFYAMIVDDIAQSLFTHDEGRQARVYQAQRLKRTWPGTGSAAASFVKLKLRRGLATRAVLWSKGAKWVKLRSRVDKLVGKCGQVAQSVERSPEKAGVGGSIPSLATMFSMTYKVRRVSVVRDANIATGGPLCRLVSIS